VRHSESDRLFDENMTASFDRHRSYFKMCGRRNKNADHVCNARPYQRLWISEDVLDAITRSHVARVPFVHVSHGCNPRAVDFA
jgi:hypothetical protein